MKQLDIDKSASVTITGPPPRVIDKGMFSIDTFSMIRAFYPLFTTAEPRKQAEDPRRSPKITEELFRNKYK